MLNRLCGMLMVPMMCACFAALSCVAAGGEFHLRSRASHKLYGPFEDAPGAVVRLDNESFKMIRGADRFHLQEAGGQRRYGPCLYEHGAFLVIGKRSFELVLQREKAFQYRPPPYPKMLPRLEDYLGRPADRVQASLAALIMAREADPNLDVNAYLSQLDEMAGELGEQLAGIAGGNQVAAIMAEYLYERRRLRADGARYHLPGVLTGGKDACVLYSFVYLAMAERLELPLHAVTVPQHVFVRYETPAERVNIETTSNGTTASDADYAARQKIARASIAAGVYLRSLSNREFAGILLHNRAVHAAQADRLQDAMRDLNLAVSIVPRDPEVLFNRARVFERQGDTDRALKDYTQALKWNPHHLQALLFRARLYSRQGEQVRAFRDCDRAVRLAPGEAAALCARGSAYLMLGDMAKAEPDFEAARVLDSKCAEAWLGLGSLYRRQGDDERALRHLDRALELNPGLGDAWAGRALIRAARGNIEEALGSLGKAIALKPADPKLYYTRGVLHGARLDKRLMLDDLRKALELDPALADLISGNKALQRDWGADQDFRALTGRGVDR